LHPAFDSEEKLHSVFYTKQNKTKQKTKPLPCQFSKSARYCWPSVLIEDVALCLNSKSERNCFKFTVQTQQQCVNIRMLWWQHVSVLLDHLQANIQRYEVQSVRIMYCGTPCFLQGVQKNSLKP